MIEGLIETCADAVGSGVADQEIRNRILPAAIERLLTGLNCSEFLDWVRQDRYYSYYYYDAEQSGVCAKPAEAAALILEAIALDSLPS